MSLSLVLWSESASPVAGLPYSPGFTASADKRPYSAFQAGLFIALRHYDSL